MHQRGFVSVLLIGLLVFVAVGAVYVLAIIKPNKIPQLPEQKEVSVQIRTDNDRFRVSDLYLIQTAIYSYKTGTNKSMYPLSLDEIKNTNYGYVPFMDPDGRAYVYTSLFNGGDYKLEATMSDGSKYEVLGSNRKFPTPMDVRRSADLTGIQSGLKGFYTQKGYYPQTLADLISAGWGMYEVGDTTPFIPTDPVTKEPYGYKTVSGKVGFMLTANLDSGIELALRSD